MDYLKKTKIHKLLLGKKNVDIIIGKTFHQFNTPSTVNSRSIAMEIRRNHTARLTLLDCMRTSQNTRNIISRASPLNKAKSTGSECLNLSVCLSLPFLIPLLSFVKQNHIKICWFAHYVNSFSRLEKNHLQKKRVAGRRRFDIIVGRCRLRNVDMDSFYWDNF
ncbi:hypothetical protein T10_7488 [Trichinella papuae]|uniref:Uncharacterized protein n=1 Tax=Trichinella papuae TaxID=268474 RepID=A0A0V1MEL6_9BILA|nr:hypothetical protein T10_7488 [Trichinella papuae]